MKISSFKTRIVAPENSIRWTHGSGKRNGTHRPTGPIPFCNVARRGLLGRCRHSRLLGQRGGLVGGLPGELRLGAAEVPVSGGFLVDGAAQVQALDDALGSEREVLAH